LKNELHDIISGEGSDGKTGIIKTAASYLRQAKMQVEKLFLMSSQKNSKQRS